MPVLMFCAQESLVVLQIIRNIANRTLIHLILKVFQKLHLEKNPFKIH
jgi:hypothetical protein